MLSVALTGGIATGKSYVRGRFEAEGLPTIDADVLARAVVAPGTPGLAAVVGRFGASVVGPGGTLDRKRLASLVFHDETARRDLEAIIHPRVYEAIAGWMARQRDEGAALALADIPLLFETGREGEFDVVVVASCPPEVQMARVMTRDATSEADARARIAAQWPIAEKARRAHHVIDTTGAFADTDRRVAEIAALLKAEAAAR